MRAALLIPFLAFQGCAVKQAQVAAHAPPNTDAVLRVFGRFGNAHACPYGNGEYALTAGHVVDLRPFDPAVDLWPLRYSTAAGYMGILDPVVAFNTSDLAIVKRRDGKPFEVAYPVARELPAPETLIYILGYDNSRKSKAFLPKVTKGTVIRVVAGNLILDEDSKPGSSGSCVLDASGQLVGIVSWGGEFPDGTVSIAVGVWEGMDEFERVKPATQVRSFGSLEEMLQHIENQP